MTSPQHVYAINVAEWDPSPDEFEQLLLLVQSEEQARIRRFKFLIDRKRALTGRLLLRKMLMDYLGVGWDNVRLGRSSTNKPILVSEFKDPPCFNMSHHGNWVAAAIHPSRDIGIDIMEYEQPRGVSTVEEFFQTMDNCFTAEEWADIRSNASDQERLRQFYRLWTFKESFIKATGDGLNFGLQRMSFRCTPRVGGTMDAELFVDGHHKEGWKFHLCQVDNQHCVAVALGPAPQTQRRPISASISEGFYNMYRRLTGASMDNDLGLDEDDSSSTTSVGQIQNTPLAVEQLLEGTPQLPGLPRN